MNLTNLIEFEKEAMLRWLEGEARSLKSYRNLCDKARIVARHTKGRWLTDAPDIASEIIHTGQAAGLSTSTINRRLAIVRRVCNLAYQWGWLEQPVGQRIKLLRENNARHYYLIADQIAALAEAAADAAPIILLLAYTGMRVSELYALRPEDVGPGQIIVRASKSGKPRRIPLPEILAGIDPLQATKVVTRQQLRTRFEKARQVVALPHIRLHDLRHSYASLLVDAGVGLTVVRDLLGHAHLGVTSRYAHLADQALDDAVAKVGKR